MKKVTELDAREKTVFVRADLDVPLSTGKSFDQVGTRLTNLKETVDYLLTQDARIFIAGHMGRPEGPDEKYSTKQLTAPLSRILSRDIHFKADFDSPADAQIVLFENLRFWPGEAKNDMDFAKKLATLGQVYVNDAFGDCHRAHASMVALPSILPHGAGMHLDREVSELTRVLKEPAHPFVAIVGGAKIETKLPVIENLAKVSDVVLVGGELPVEIKKLNLKFGPNVSVADLIENNKDITERSLKSFCDVLASAKTVVWNGPMGLFEEGYTRTSLELAAAIVESGAYSIIGGGETTQLMAQNFMLKKFSFVSAGGGAMLEFLAGKTLPGLAALS